MDLKIILVVFSLFFFTFSVSDYNSNFAQMYAYHSSVAYCSNNTKILKWDCSPCSKISNFIPYKIFQDPSTDTSGYLGSTDNGNTIVVSFRGTNAKDIKNWITNLNFAKQTPYKQVPDAAVHDGFLNAYEKLSPQIISGVKDLIGTKTKVTVYITGHSLGGALATLCAVDLKISFGIKANIFLYTFGTPRVGNQAFAQYCNALTNENWRLVHYADLVPQLPLQRLKFHHEPREVWYNEPFTSFKICDTTGEDSTCSDGLGTEAISIPDHLHYFNFPIGSFCN